MQINARTLASGPLCASPSAKTGHPIPWLAMLKRFVFLCVLALVLTTSAIAQRNNKTTPGFSCGGNLFPTEAIICSDEGLASLDRQLTAIYGSSLRNLPADEQAELKAAEGTWVAERNRCGTDKSCIRNAYEARISSLGGRASQISTSQPSPYVVDGLALGGQVRFDSEAYRQYHCTPSDKFPGFTWCHKEKTEQTKRGEVVLSNSILHTSDGIALYVNRYIEPAFFGPNEVRNEIDRLSAKFGERARELRMPPRGGLPNALIAVWGKIDLEPLDPADVSAVASGGTVKGLLISFLGDLQRSAKAGVRVYKLAGGAGFLWAATFNQDGRGVLRFLTTDASEIEPAAAPAPSPSITTTAPGQGEKPEPSESTATRRSRSCRRLNNVLRVNSRAL